MVIWSEYVFKGNLMLQFSWLEEFRQGNVSWWWTLDQLQTINFKLCTHISERLLHKTMPSFFLTITFYWNNSTSFKAHFAWKQLTVHYSINIRKKENRGHCFVFILVGYMSVKKKYWTLVSVHLWRYYKNVYIIAPFIFFNVFLYCLKGCSETLK